MNRQERRGGRRLLRGLVLGLVAAALCGAALVAVVSMDFGRLAPGSCSWGFGGGRGGGTGEAGELLESPNFEASPAAARDLRSGVVDERLVSALLEVTEEHRICVDAFKEGHYFLPGVTDGPFIPDGYGEAGGLPNTHYHGRAADIRRVDGKPVRGNGSDSEVLGVGEVLTRIAPDQRPDQTIGPPDWTETLGRSREEGWVLDEDQLDLHEAHLHLGYRSNSGTNNTR